MFGGGDTQEYIYFDNEDYYLPRSRRIERIITNVSEIKQTDFASLIISVICLFFTSGELIHATCTMHKPNVTIRRSSSCISSFTKPEQSP